jgi:hypothetical protein
MYRQDYLHWKPISSSKWPQEEMGAGEERWVFTSMFGKSCAKWWAAVTVEMRTAQTAEARKGKARLEISEWTKT